MGILTCACPKPAEIQTIDAPSCNFKIEQLVRLALVRDPETANFDSIAPITALASWTALLSATDDTKHVVTPLFSNGVIPNSEALEEGGNDNTTVNGIPIYFGEGVVQVTGFFRNLEPAIKTQLKALSCESATSASGVPEIGAFMFNRAGDIFHKEDSTPDPLPIGIYNFRVGTRGTEGYAKDDIIPFSFYLDAEWDTGLVRTARADLDFNPLTQL